MSDTRFSHIHEGATFTDQNGVSHTGKGRLLATVATTELPDGTLAVGVARCNISDNPVRLVGKRIAESRLNRFTKHLRREEMKEQQHAKLSREMEAMLVFRMDRAAFVDKVIRRGAFRRLALAENESVQNAILQDLRDSVL